MYFLRKSFNKTYMQVLYESIDVLPLEIYWTLMITVLTPQWFRNIQILSKLLSHKDPSDTNFCFLTRGNNHSELQLYFYFHDAWKCSWNMSDVKMKSKSLLHSWDILMYSGFLYASYTVSCMITVHDCHYQWNNWQFVALAYWVELRGSVEFKVNWLTSLCNLRYFLQDDVVIMDWKSGGNQIQCMYIKTQYTCIRGSRRGQGKVKHIKFTY